MSEYPSRMDGKIVYLEAPKDGEQTAVAAAKP
jgi:hypothetical protein